MGNKEKVLKFRTKCGKDFECAMDGYEGLVLVGREACDDNPSQEDCDRFHVKGISDSCKACIEEHKHSYERHRHLIKDRENPFGGGEFNVYDTHCKGDLIDSPFPKVDPITGHKLYMLTKDWDDENETIIPLYREENEGEEPGDIHSIPTLHFECDTVYYGYRKVEDIDDEGMVNFEPGVTVIVPNSKKLIGDICKKILDRFEYGSQERRFMESLMLSLEKMANEDDYCDNEDEDGLYEDEEEKELW